MTIEIVGWRSHDSTNPDWLSRTGIIVICGLLVEVGLGGGRLVFEWLCRLVKDTKFPETVFRSTGHLDTGRSALLLEIAGTSPAMTDATSIDADVDANGGRSPDRNRVVC